MKKKILILATGLTATAVALGAFALHRSGGEPAAAATTTAATVTTSYLDGYELDPSLTAATAFPGNELVFEAQVLGQDEARKVTAQGAEGRLTYIYTPVRVQVRKVMKGNLKPGQTVTLRALGGTVGSERTVSRLSPDLTQYAASRRLVVMAGQPVDAGDGVTAIAPNYLLGFNQAGAVFNVDHPAESLPTAKFATAVASSAGTSTVK